MKSEFKRDDIGTVLEHKLGFLVVVVKLDKLAEDASSWSSEKAFCRYILNGVILMDTFHTKELKWPEDNKEENDDE